MSRYLVSDAAVLSGKPLVSASALRTEGQLLVLNNPPSSPNTKHGGPCYRCVFPTPPPADSVVGCGEGGVLGPVVGVMGVLMAFEAIKILTSNLWSTGRRPRSDSAETESVPPSLLLFSSYGTPQFRHVRLRGKRPRCVACSTEAIITKESLTTGSIDYSTFCGLRSRTTALDQEERIQAKDFRQIRLDRDKAYFLLDVRDETQFGICSLSESINIPISVIEAKSRVSGEAVNDENLKQFKKLEIVEQQPADSPIYTICRFGNDSQIAVRKLKELGYDNGGRRWIGDVQGGLQAWAQDVDPQWPQY